MEARWCRYGKDRIYVRTADGRDVGYVDLVARTVVSSEPTFEPALLSCLERQSPPASSLTERPTVSNGDQSVTHVDKPAAAPPVVPATPTTEDVQPEPALAAAPIEALALDEVPRDLVQNIAGAAVRSKRKEVNAQAPVMNLVARMLGVKTEERSWRVGAKGEEKVAVQLAKLDRRWHRMHAIEVGVRGSEIDHLVIGPPGVTSPPPLGGVTGGPSCAT